MILRKNNTAVHISTFSLCLSCLSLCLPQDGPERKSLQTGGQQFEQYAKKMKKKLNS